MADTDSPPPTSLYGKALDYTNYWFTKTPPLHKFLDVVVLFVALLLGGTLWVAYQRTDALLSFVGHALREYPRMDMEAVAAGWNDLYATAKATGATCVELHHVDMARNTRSLVKIQSDDPAAVEMYGPVGQTRAFLVPSFSPEHLAGAAALVTGDFVIAHRITNPNALALYVPIPDHPGQLLCGVLVLTYPITTSREDITAARVAVLDFVSSIIE